MSMPRVLCSLKRWRTRDRPVWALIRLLPRLSRVGSLALTGLVLAEALLPIGYILVVGALVASVPATLRAGLSSPAADQALRALVVFGVIIFLQQLSQPCLNVVAGALGRRVTRFTTEEVLTASLRPVGIAHLEDPRVADRISLAQSVGVGTYPPALAVSALAQVAAARLSGLAAAITLAGVLWWAPLPLAAVWVLTGRRIDREIRLAVQAFQAQTPGLRRAAYLRDLSLDGSGAKEIRVFGLGSWILGRFSDAWLLGMRELFQSRAGKWVLAVRFVLLGGAHAAVLGALGLANAHGLIGIGQVTVGVQAVLAMASLGFVGDMQWILPSASAAIPHALAVSNHADEMPNGPRSANGLPA